MNVFILWLAQGFGVGRIPFAPGTFGSIVGLGWFALLLTTGNLWLFALGTILGIVASVWLCGAGERILKQTDPGSVVMDEIIAIPICFMAWVLILWHQTGHLPSPEHFFSQANWLPTAGVFAAFRFFDVLKPWPVRQSQALAGGWGVTVDDVLAAIYVNGCVLLVFALQPLWVRR